MELEFAMRQLNGDSEFAACAAKQLKLLASSPQWGQQEMTPKTNTQSSCLGLVCIHPPGHSQSRKGGGPPCFMRNKERGEHRPEAWLALYQT